MQSVQIFPFLLYNIMQIITQGFIVTNSKYHMR